MDNTKNPSVFPMGNPFRSSSASIFPAGVKHWHGAAADSWFSHLAVEVSGEDTYAEWLEAVTDDDYSKL